MYKTLEDVKRVISLGKAETVIDTFVGSYLQGLEKEKWIEATKTEYETLYPKQLPNPDYVVPLETRIVNPLYVVDGEESYWIANPDYVEPLDEFIDNVDYIDYDTYMSETEAVQVGTKDILDEDGITVIGTEPVFEDRLIRQYSEVLVDVPFWKATSPEYKVYFDNLKDEKLGKLTVTTSTGKVFYGDAISRSDLTDAVLLGNMNGITETTWKLAEEFNGERVVLVTIEELAEASYLALQRKGQIVGAI